MLNSTADKLSAVNGSCPVRSSNSTTPSEKMSDRPSTFLPAICSGDMYVGVPNTIFVCDLAARGHLRNTEIHDFHDAILREHDVCRLDVAMDDALLMGIVQGVRDGGHESGGPR
mgnify:CR=1 FL=1